MRLLVPVSAVVVTIVVLFVCTHGSVVERLKHSRVPFIHVPACSYGGMCTTTFSALRENARTRRENPPDFSTSRFQWLPSKRGPKFVKYRINSFFFIHHEANLDTVQQHLQNLSHRHRVDAAAGRCIQFLKWTDK